MQNDIDVRIAWLEREVARLTRLLEKLEELNGVNNQNALLRAGNPQASS